MKKLAFSAFFVHSLQSISSVKDMLKVKVISLRKSHIDDLLRLMEEFDYYLGTLSSSPREPFDTGKKREKILKDGFGRNPQYRGYMAKI